MNVVRTLTDTQQISNTDIRQLVQKRINDLGGEAFNSAELGYFLVVEGGDTFDDLSAQLGFDILCNRITGTRFGETGFTTSFEFVEEFPSSYDMVFVLSDDGYGVEVFVPKEEGVEPQLIAMCRTFAFVSDGEDAP